MKILKQVLKEHVVDVVCDICHQSTKDELGICEYAQLSSHWGYSSSKDCEYHELCLCESCYDKIIAYVESLGGKVSITDYF
ncbi:MAG: hypothetical protein HQK65_23525 [Desulfamplus sp.]|nr:hypothetical protein [Desulfamplus sp.]